ncbi:hypothetical protein OPT61_g4152 [Boeremia exigua]|uniref:Uncharacterized protein n=1 Tax=Boeremia exigua TaxID=749465 RepID=A0ACC2IF88_9PLEO|nr:hypothetical protein OPT61_g4152 [Boeremia exigua]
MEHQRAGSIAVLMIFRPLDAREQRYAITTQQARTPVDSLRFPKIPTGMLDRKGVFTGESAKAIEKLTGIKIEQRELVNLTELALSESNTKELLYSNPRGSDDFTRIYLWEKELSRQLLQEIVENLANQTTQGNTITVKLSTYDNMWSECVRDARSITAWALYEGLRREGIIQGVFEELRRAHDSSSSLESLASDRQ